LRKIFLLHWFPENVAAGQITDYPRSAYTSTPEPWGLKMKRRHFLFAADSIGLSAKAGATLLTRPQHSRFPADWREKLTRSTGCRIVQDQEEKFWLMAELSNGQVSFPLYSVDGELWYSSPNAIPAR
jgi:hypothetical protein